MNPLIATIITLLLVIRSYRRQSLTPFGILAAILTATIHALYPSPLPFTLLCAFFVIGTAATKVKHDVKATLTLSSSGSPGGEGARTSIQVLANSICASILILFHLYKYGIGSPQPCFGNDANTPATTAKDRTSDLLLLGIISNYAAVAADTLSSELGILSKSKPVLITTLRPVPRGTNGGVTIAGLAAGVFGSIVIASTSILFFPFCSAAPESTESTSKSQNLPTLRSRADTIPLFVLIITIGTLGTLLDSLLGAFFQASVIDRRTGKVIEGTGGVKVLTSRLSETSHSRKRSSSTPEEVSQPATVESRMINSGHDILDNNQINFLMASIMSVAGMGIAGIVWNISIKGLAYEI